MSITKTSSVFCDSGAGPRDGCHSWVAETIEGAAAARKIAKTYGWVRIKGRDLCPNCKPGTQGQP